MTATFMPSLPSLMTIGIWPESSSILFVPGKDLKPLFQEISRGESLPPSQSRVAREETDAPKPEMMSAEVQTEEVTEPQLEELLRTRTKQAQAIRTLQGIVGKKIHDLQVVRNWTPTANAVGTVYFCPDKVWHASERCARNRAGGRLIARRPCAYCGDEQVEMHQMLQDILYPSSAQTSTAGLTN